MKVKKFLVPLLCIALAACGQDGTEQTSAETAAETVTETTAEITAETTAETAAETTAGTTTVTTTETTTETTMETAAVTVPEPDLSGDGFTVDLKKITPDTDLFALTNAVEHKMSDGEFAVDLDGDGWDEKISVASEPTEITDLYSLYAVINGEKFELQQYDIYESWSIPESVFICDIDSSDGYVEFAYTCALVTNDYRTDFFRYENGELRYIFTLGDTFDGESELGCFADEMNASVTGKPIITDGSGVITASRRLDGQTWFAYSHYRYDSATGEVSLVCEPVYPYYYENMNNYSFAENAAAEYYQHSGLDKTCLSREITVYAEPDLESEKITIAPQNVQLTAEYPLNEPDYENYSEYELWVYIIAEDGSHGWLYTCGGRVDDVNGGELLYRTIGNLVLYD